MTAPHHNAVAIASFAAAIAIVALVPACSEEEIVLAKLPPTSDSGSTEATRCVDDTNCSSRAYCARAHCGDIGGACESRPVVCGEEIAPVCGCDGITYWNDCLRRAAGISAMMPGECMMNARICGDPSGGPPSGGGPGGPPPPPPPSCPTGTFCARLQPPFPDMPDPGPPKCLPDIGGTCWALPAVCPLNAGPDRWIECGPAAGCVTTCDAIRTGLPYVRARECH